MRKASDSGSSALAELRIVAPPHMLDAIQTALVGALGEPATVSKDYPRRDGDTRSSRYLTFIVPEKQK